MSIIGNPIMAGVSGPAASIFVTGLSETDTVTAVHKKTVQVPNPDYVVPDGYTQLEYIESTGTQYINPNINIVNGFYTKCVYRPTDLNTDNHVLSSRTSTGFLFAAWQQKTNGVGLAFGSSDSNNTFTSYSSSDVVITQETTILSSTAKSSFNGSEFASIQGTASNVNSAPLYLFCMYDSGKASYFAKVKLYELYASVDGVPTHDFIPCKRTSDNAIGLYDLVNNAFYTNAGTGVFTAGSEIPAYIEMTVDDKTLTGKWTQKPNPDYIGLPEGYTQLEYIESTGTQWIDTGVKSIYQRLRTKVMFTTTDSFHVASFWQASNQQIYHPHPSNGKFSIRYADKSAQLDISALSNTIYEIDSTMYNGNQNVTINGINYLTSNNTYSFTNNYSLYLFGSHDSETPGVYNPGKMRMYYAELYDNGALVRDFIPAKRLSDNAVGLYDLVSNTFFGNQGTVAFIAGQEIQKTIGCWLISNIRDLGTWTVTATDGTKTATQDVLVDVITEYEIEMGYKPVGALYWLGDECEDITGGWTCQAGIATSSVQKEDNSIYTDGLGDGSGSISITNNAIDLTNYSKIYAEVSDFEYGRCGPVIQVVYDSVSYSNPGTFTGCGWPQGSLGTGIIDASTINDGDISGLTGLHKIGFLVATGGAYSDSYIRGHLYKIWLE